MGTNNRYTLVNLAKNHWQDSICLTRCRLCFHTSLGSHQDKHFGYIIIWRHISATYKSRHGVSPYLGGLGETFLFWSLPSAWRTWWLHEAWHLELHARCRSKISNIVPKRFTRLQIHRNMNLNPICNIWFLKDVSIDFRLRSLLISKV